MFSQLLENGILNIKENDWFEAKGFENGDQVTILVSASSIDVAKICVKRDLVKGGFMELPDMFKDSLDKLNKKEAEKTTGIKILYVLEGTPEEIVTKLLMERQNTGLSSIRKISCEEIKKHIVDDVGYSRLLSVPHKGNGTVYDTISYLTMRSLTPKLREYWDIPQLPAAHKNNKLLGINL